MQYECELSSTSGSAAVNGDVHHPLALPKPAVLGVEDLRGDRGPCGGSGLPVCSTTAA